jgi:Ca-activated chloride channel family protein
MRITIGVAFSLACVLWIAIGFPSARAQQAPQKPQDEPPILKTGTNLVTLTVSVTDPQERFVTGLEAENFEVYDEKVLQKIEFFSDEDAPVSVGIIFDVSGSMKGRVNRSNIALRKFMDTCHEEDEFFLVGFNSQAKLLADFTPNPERITSAVLLAETKGQTALYDAVYIATEKIRQGRHTRKALIIISDGQDNNSRYTFREVRERVREADVQIYSLGVTSVFSGNTLEMEGQSILEELSRLTGGRAFFPSNDLELQEVITRIGIELRHQYSIGYTPTTTDQSGNRWHKIKVKINAPKGLPTLTVRAKEGYYADFGRTQQ